MQPDFACKLNITEPSNPITNNKISSNIAVAEQLDDVAPDLAELVAGEGGVGVHYGGVDGVEGAEEALPPAERPGSARARARPWQRISSLQSRVLK
jgi:hypothetical protein